MPLKDLGYIRLTALAAVAAGASVATVGIPLCGLLSDRIGRRATFRIGSVGLIVFAGPYFWLLSQRSTFCIVLATVVAIGLIWPFVTASLSTMLAEMFGSEVLRNFSWVSDRRRTGWRHCATFGDTAACRGSRSLAMDSHLHRGYCVCFPSRGSTWSRATAGCASSA